ncbi:hypothetical protein BC940DRAFT_301929 [Gongronella butleri]|nr:hypothetical protein BC940DRAFT_301929 [Gongronella butleri]
MSRRIKLKWVALKTWLARQSTRRKRTSTSDGEQTPRRPSHCTSCCTSQPSLMEDDDRPPKSLFSINKRRSSYSSQMSAMDIQRELEKIHEMYTFALDELNYAGDSLGTFYYDNDRISAQEAIENFSGACKSLLDQTHDPLCKTQLHSIIYPRMMLLQKNLDALPHDPPLRAIYLPTS